MSKVSYMQYFDNCATAMFELAAARLNNSLNDEKRDYNPLQKNKKYFKCIHYRNTDFMEKIAAAKRHLDYDAWYPKFLDVGCGVGQKVFLAGLAGFTAHGIELRKPFVKKANELLTEYDETAVYQSKKSSKSNTRVSYADGIKYTKYNEFDVIYFYRPIADDKLQEKLETKIAKDAKKGAVVVAVYSPIVFDKNHPIFIKNGWTEIERNIFQKSH